MTTKLERCQDELEACQAMLGDALGERGLKPLWAVSITHGDDLDPDEVVVRAKDQDEVEHHIREHLAGIFGGQEWVATFNCRGWRLKDRREGILDEADFFELDVSLE